MFKPRAARKSLRRYRKKGLDKIERRMVASVSAGGLEGARILDEGIALRAGDIDIVYIYGYG